MEGVEILAYPEMALTTYFPKRVRDDFDQFFETEMPPKALAPLLQRAREARIACHVGFCEKDQGRYFNTALLTDETGKLAGTFRKIHLPGAKQPDGHAQVYEPHFFESGNSGYRVFDAAGAKVGIAICQDRRFPESYRSLGLLGAEIVLIGYNTPLSPLALDLNELCLRAGAYQNNLFVVGIAKAGVEDGMELIGGSCIVNPMGQVVAKAATTGDELIAARIDLDQMVARAQAVGLPGAPSSRALRAADPAHAAAERSDGAPRVSTCSFAAGAWSPRTRCWRPRWRVSDGQIVALGAESMLPPAERTIDATGKYVLPGLIDCHVHLGAVYDDWHTGPLAAAHAGLTTLLSFVEYDDQARETLPQALKRLRDEAGQQSVVDFGFHFILNNQPYILDGLAEAFEQGVTSYKIFMTYKRRPNRMCSDEFIAQVMEKIAALGGICQLHCENGDILYHLENKSIAAGKVKPTDFPATCPPWTEEEAINRAILIGEMTKCPVYVVHLSTRGGLERIKAAQARGQRVWTETCPQYLLLTEKEMEAWARSPRSGRRSGRSGAATARRCGAAAARATSPLWPAITRRAAGS